MQLVRGEGHDGRTLPQQLGSIERATAEPTPVTLPGARFPVEVVGPLVTLDEVEPSWSRTTEHGADPPDHPAATDVVLVVDVANVMGSRPDGWWRERKAAAARLLTALGRVIGAETAGPDGRNLRIGRIVAVLEGATRGAVAPGVVRVTDVDPTGSTEASGSIKSAVTSGTDHPTDRPAVEVVEAERDGDSTIVAVTEKLVRALPSASPETAERVEAVLVVTADRGLRRRLPPDAITVGPEWLNRLIGR